MKKRIQRKIEELREEPEHVRMRAVSYITIVSGVVLVVLWLVVFLPLQLYIQRSGEKEQTTAESEEKPEDVADLQPIQQTASPRPQIGGIQDRRDLASPTPSTESVPVVSSPSDQLPLSTTTPTP